MRLLVCGAGGMLAGAVRDLAAERGHEVIALARAELDVGDESAVRRSISVQRPDAVLNGAAWTDVDGAEADPLGAARLNAHAPGVLARACSEAGAQLVHPSTDYVFSGHALTGVDGEPRPYQESDPVAPRSVYGQTKLAGEQAVAAAGEEHAIVRTSWLFGAGGRNFVDTMLRLGAEREEVAVVDDQTGCPTFTGHLAGALLDIAEGRLSGLRHAAGAGWCTWNELAREVFAAAGLPCRVTAATSAELDRPAPRPAWSVLASELEGTPVLPPWREGVREHLAARSVLR